MARFISMKDFRSDAALKMVRGTDTTVVLGQITGHVTATKVKTIVDKDGKENESIVCFGDFRGVAYGKRSEAQSKGEVYLPIEAEQIYLPKYYAELIESKIKTTKGPLLFAVEIVMAPSAGILGYSYDVRSILARPAESPLAQLHAKMREAGLMEPEAKPLLAMPNFPDMTDEPRPNTVYLGKHETKAETAPAATEPHPDDNLTIDPETGEVTEGEDATAEDKATRKGKKRHG